MYLFRARARLGACAAIFCTSVVAQGLAIKDYQLGAPMSSCPPGSSVVVSDGPETICELGPTTLANQPAKSFTVAFYQDQISMVYVKLSARGQYANGDVLQALREKFGFVSKPQSHINRYTWYRGTQTLVFDGWDGSVLLMDQVTYRKISAEKAEKNKSDL